MSRAVSRHHPPLAMWHRGKMLNQASGIGVPSYRLVASLSVKKETPSIPLIRGDCGDFKGSRKSEFPPTEG